jgi:uncharacterized protein
MRHILVIAAVSMLIASPARAGYQDGMDAFERGDYETALEEFLPLAQQGSPQARYDLGVLYDNGYGVVQDYSEAAKWYRLAAEQGYARAQYNLAGMYRLGQGVPQSYGDALAWYRLAADQGHARAQHNLGSMYANGHGVAQDLVQAYMWYFLATANGLDNARQASDMISKWMTPDQIEEAERLAHEWLAAHQ